MKTKECKHRAGVAGAILLMHLCVSCLSAWAQAPSSRQIPFSGVHTNITPNTPGQTLTLRVLNDDTPPVALYCETQTLDVDANGAITFNLGAGTAANPPCASAPPGLNPADFASGSTRSLDVVDTTGATVLPNPPGPIPLLATAFALSPGPAGPAGPKGDPGQQGAQGPQGPPGVVQAVSAGDGSVTVGGTAANPTVAVAANGITNAKIVDGALSPAKITGTAAIINGPNTFNGPLAVAPRSTSYGLRIDQGASGHGLLSYVNTTSGSQFVFAAASLATGGLNVMGNGNVGIGTSTPSQQLEVVGNVKASSTLLATGLITDLDIVSRLGDIKGGNLHANGGVRAENGISAGGNGTVAVDAPGVVGGRFTVLPNGNVGVGTASPGAKLDVAGSVRIGGDTPMSSNPHMSFSALLLGSFCGEFNCGGALTTTPYPGGFFVPDRDITITRVTIVLTGISSGCSSPARIRIPTPSGPVLVGIPPATNFVDSGPLAIRLPAGSPTYVSLSNLTTGCSLGQVGGGDAFINVQYVMQ